MKIVVLDGYTENPGDLSWEEMGRLGELTVYDRTPADDEEIALRITGASPTSRSASPSFTRMASGASPRRWRRSAIWWSCASPSGTAGILTS